jgi:hypothetical protein
MFDGKVPDQAGGGAVLEPPSAAPPPGPVPLERLEAQLCEVAGHLAAATCQFLVLLAEFDARRGWASWEANSCAAWLSWKCQMSSGTAREHVRVARALRDLPLIRGEFATARIHQRLTWRFEDDGSLSGSFRLPPLPGAVLLKALRAAATDLDQPPAGVSAETPGSADDPADPADPARCHVEDGSAISVTTAQMVTCTAALSWMLHGRDGAILDLGRKRRRPNAALRKAARERDRGRCRFPGCESRRIDLHHIQYWANGGRTSLDNLICLCKRHHMAVHERGYLIASPDGTFFRPDGTPLPPSPPLPAPDGPISDIHDAEITPETIIPSWFGERLDLDYAIYTCLANDKNRQAGRDPGATRTRAVVLEPGNWYPVLCQYKEEQPPTGDPGRIPFLDWLEQRSTAARSPAA